MENLNDRVSIYKDYLNNAFEKIKKNLPKKHKDLRDMIIKAQDDLKSDKEDDLNANKYFQVFKLSMQTGVVRIIESCLYYLQKLISNNFLDGDCIDSTYHINLEEAITNIPQFPDAYYYHRRLVDTIIENICLCNNEKDDNIQLLVINILLTMLTNPTIKVHDRSLITAFRTFIHIYSQSKNNVIQTTAKAALTQSANTLFIRMENQQKLIDEKKSDHNVILSVLEDLDIKKIKEAEPILQNYMQQVMTNIVDNVCLYEEKIKLIDEKNENKESSNDKALIPLRAVPLVGETDDAKYKKIVSVSLDNEGAIVSGKFGWCFVCRKTANVYCKETRVPVCTADCKKKHLEELYMVNNYFGISNVKKENEYIHDCLEVLRTLSKISLKESKKDASLSLYNIRSKLIALEHLFILLEKPIPTLQSNKDFLEILKNTLCDSLLQNCVNQEKAVFSQSFAIFNQLVNHYKEGLKNEIVIFLDNIFVKFLESGNSSFSHKLLALEVFNKIFKNPKNVLEFFINYDCSVDNVNITEKMVEVLTRIAQGKYIKSVFAVTIQPNQELVLRTMALETLIEMLRGLSKFVEEAENEREKAEKGEEKKEESEGDEKDNTSNAGGEEGVSKFEAYDTIEKSRMVKLQLQKAIRKFNFKWKHGVQFLVSNGFVANKNAADLAKIFFNSPNISKDKLGEFFGEEDTFNIEVLGEYADYMQFKNMNIDDGLRFFLDHFTLPGEAQKVDRIIQIFAQKYYKYNPEPLSSTTAAYTLSYLLIMLQTDLHNPQVKEKMKLIEFIKLARGMNDGADLSPEYLTGLYTRVQKTPLALHEKAQAEKNAQEAVNSSIRKKQYLFQQESRSMLTKGKDLLKALKDSNYITVSYSNVDFVRSVLEIIWSPCLASFSVLLEENDDTNILALCLDGFSYGIKLTSIFNMNTEREAWVVSLAKFTSLTTIKEIKEKNIMCMKVLINIALNYGNYLKSSWFSVLECVSRLEYLHVLGTGGRRDSDIFHITNANPSRQSEIHEVVEQMNSENLLGHIDPADIDKIFNRSVNLDGESILDFINALCKLSEEELKNLNNPRIFSLQRIVEVADFNMGRVRIIWTRIWNIMKEFFSKVGCHPNNRIAMYVIDSLKQLSNKFLHIEELSHFEFQKEFLKPFETIFTNLPVSSSDLKEFIMTCMLMITQTMFRNLKSGWKIILNLIILSLHEETENLVHISFEIIRKIMKENLDFVFDNLIELINSLKKMSKYKEEEISLSSIEYLQRCLVFLIDKVHFYEDQSKKEIISNRELSAEIPGDKPLENQKDLLSDHKKLLDNLWIPILNGFSNLFGEYRDKVQTKSLETLFDILKTYGASFTKDFWIITFKGVLRPLFDDIHFTFHTKVQKNEASKIKISCQNAFNYLVELFSLFFDKLSGIFNEIVEIIMNCIQNTHEALAKISVTSFRSLIINNGHKLHNEHWEIILDTIEKIFKLTTPKQLMDHKLLEITNPGEAGFPEKNGQTTLNFNTEECVTQCIVQLFSIGVIKDVIESQYQHLTSAHITKLLKILDYSYNFAKDFNEEIALRNSLWMNGFMPEMKQLPGLLKQEREALSCYCLILFKHYEMNKNKEKEEEILDLFITKSIIIFDVFYKKQKELLEYAKFSKKYPRKSIREDKQIINSKDSDKDKKTEELKKSTLAASNNENSLNVEESILRKLKIHESEREIINLRVIITNIVIPKLLTVDIQMMKKRIKELVFALSNISIYSFSKCFSCLTCNHCQACTNCNHICSEDTNLMIKTLLNKLLEWITKDM